MPNKTTDEMLDDWIPKRKPHWKYKTVVRDLRYFSTEEIDKMLDDMAAEGWELADMRGFLSQKTEEVYIFRKLVGMET